MATLVPPDTKSGRPVLKGIPAFLQRRRHFGRFGHPRYRDRLGSEDRTAIGGAFDLTGSGKTKVFASYGWFYERMRFELPRGFFGGNFYRVEYYPITAATP